MTLEGVESVSLVSVWMLEPPLPQLLWELGRRGYVTARVRPRSLGGYNITFLEPGIVAVKGRTYLVYDGGRRQIIVEGPDAKSVSSAFNEVEDALSTVVGDPSRGVLFYELQAKAKAHGDRLIMKKAFENRPI